MKTVLDIGTGTGLLALLYAQKNQEAIIDAVEIDEAAFQQAQENFETSPWKERLHVYNVLVQQFDLSRKYDLIISNPPFFENDLKSENEKRNLALHSSALSLEELLNAVIKYLNDGGSFTVLLPFHRSQEFEELARKRFLYLSKKVLIKQTPQHNYFRSLLLFSKKINAGEESEIVIQNKDGRYTNEFIELLKDYYLYL